MPVVITPIQTETPTCSWTVTPDLLDLNCDWTIFDGMKPATLYARGTDSTHYLPHALFTITKDTEAQVSDGVYIREHGLWLVPAEYVPVDVIIRPGDSVDGWIVQAVDKPFLNSAWEMLADRLIFNLPLTDTIDYYSVTVETDDFGGRVLEKDLIDTEITCSIQPVTSETEEKHGPRVFHNTSFNIYLPQDIEARVGDVVEDQDERVYEIISVNNRTRIDEFTRLNVKLVVNTDEVQ